ncbi:hypothetical protein AGR4C_Lc120164 [Agrobacterium tumefaciens str. Kerr 14]|uniref:Uncharacterized protein n=1 Tax=Agrobacterium tumefaciens str. Kerr 14 TaxID=1183424 RepID=A0A1S7RAG9_AGRTU|nr:hypothetical protein AGR4C_Lc120164 [Agrobacterium tumefaciens str. Kerr 14]
MRKISPILPDNPRYKRLWHIFIFLI